MLYYIYASGSTYSTSYTDDFEDDTEASMNAFEEAEYVYRQEVYNKKAPSFSDILQSMYDEYLLFREDLDKEPIDIDSYQFANQENLTEAYEESINKYIAWGYEPVTKDPDIYYDDYEED